jgi:hypothetical protein
MAKAHGEHGRTQAGGIPPRADPSPLPELTGTALPPAPARDLGQIATDNGYHKLPKECWDQGRGVSEDMQQERDKARYDSCGHRDES